MCIICVSEQGVQQPTERILKAMWKANPHGAGYMVSRAGHVEIHKGFMNYSDFINAVRAENFTNQDSVVYHFRISTQAGVQPTMTHPFPLTGSLKYTEALDLRCNIGVAHNGIIELTSDPNNKRYSDTALFITQYLHNIIKEQDDIFDEYKLAEIEFLAGSKFAIMNRSGKVATVGDFQTIDGLKFSNMRFINALYDICEYDRKHKKNNRNYGYYKANSSRKDVR